MGRHVRWQAVIAILGIILLGALLSYAAYNFPSSLAPARGGTYVEGVAGSPQYLNPLLGHFNEVDRDLAALLFNGLTTLDERGAVVPDLATRWEISEDGRVYTFYLRDDVRWHDGAPFTADDVIYTIGLMQSPDFSWAPWLSSLWQSVQVEKVDDYTVRFTLDEPFTPFLDHTTIGILPAHLWSRYQVSELNNAQLNIRPVGTGPWQLVQIDAEHARLEPNPFYRGPLPFLGALEFRFYPDMGRLFAAFERDEVNAIGHIFPDDVRSALRLRNLNLFSSVLPGYTLVYLNQNSANVPFLQDRTIRQALLLALDRQKLVDEALQGQGVVAHSPIQPDSWAHDASVTQYPYDPDRARALLDSAGWIDTDGDGVRDKDGKPLEFTLLTTDATDQMALGQNIARQWGAIGVRLVPQAITFAGLVADHLSTHNYDAALVSWELSGDPDPYPLWHSTEIEGGQNYGLWNNRQADETMEAARRTSDVNQRIDLLKDFQALFAEEVPALLLYHPVYSFGVHDKVRGVTISKLNGSGDRFRAASDWYIATERISTGAARRLDNSTP